MSRSNKIRHIVRIRQMLKQWRRKARVTASFRGSASAPADVPAGHVAVNVGAGCKRFIVRATDLNHPIFKKLLSQAAEEYGFSQVGPLTIPCDESVFEEIMKIVSWSESGRIPEDLQRCCHVGMLSESRPLLRETDKSVF